MTYFTKILTSTKSIAYLVDFQRFKKMNIALLFTFTVLTTIGNLSGQVNYSTDFNVANDANGEGNWDNTGWQGNSTSPCDGSGLSMEDNCFGTGTSQIVEMSNSNSLGTTDGGELTVAFAYKILEFNDPAATPAADFGRLEVFSGTTSTGPWTSRYLLTTHVASTTCAPKSFTYTPASGEVVFLRFEVEHSGVGSPDFDAYIDDLSVIETVCTDPTATYSVNSANCGGGNFSIDVNVTAMGDADAIVITDNQGGTFNNGGAGYVLADFPVNVGTYAANTNVVITVDDNDVSCPASSASLTTDCACSMTPTATVTSGAPDCGNNNFDISVTVTSFGDGANADIYINNVLELSNVSMIPQTINKPVGTYTVTIKATGDSGFIICDTDYSATAACTNLDCATAFNVPTDGSAISTTGLPATSTTYEASSCDASGNEENWFKFTAPSSGVVLMDVDNYTSTFQTVVYAVYSGACGTLSEVTCGSASSGSPAPAVVWTNELISGLTGGNVYYLEISTGSGSGQTFDVAMTSPIADISANTQECWDLSTATTLFDLGDSGDDYDCGFSSVFSGSTDDQVAYVYTPAANETVDVVIDNVVDSEGSDFAFAIFNNTTGTPVSCLDGTTISADATLTGVSLTGGTAYIIIIGGQASIHDATGCLTIKQQCNTVYTTSIANDCGAGTYVGTVNFSNLGSVASSVSISDGTTTYNSISTGTDYTFTYANVESHVVTVTGSSADCEEAFTFNSGCNGLDDFGTSAPDITNACSPGDMTIATAGSAVGFTPGCDNGNLTAPGVGTNVIRDCSNANFDNNTDWFDLWYQVDLPDGTDQMTLSVTGLSGEDVLGFVLHTADPGTNASNNVASVDGNFECSFFEPGITSHTVTGLADESTAPIYIRILAINYDDTDGCGAINHPTFTICTTVPQANGVCVAASAPNITTNNGGALQSGNFADYALSTVSIPADCGGTTIPGTVDTDAWYQIERPTTGADNVQIQLDINTTETVYAMLYSFNNFTSDGCPGNGNSPTACGVYDASTSSLIFDEYLSGGDDVFFVRLLTASNTMFDVSAQLIVPNNVCSGAGGTDYNIGTTQRTANFNWASDSGALPATSGRDLWFQFDPDGSVGSYSTQVEFSIGDLTGDQEVTLMVYLDDEDGCSSNAANYIVSETFTSDATKIVSCLDELHGPTDGGYTVRLVQTAGSTIANNVSIQASPNPGGPFNNDAENIWDGNGPVTFSADPYIIPNNDPFDINNVILADFENSTDCHPDITTSDCSGGNSNTPINEFDDRDEWFVFQFGTPLSSCDLTVSQTINSASLCYNSGMSGENGYIYIYDDVDNDGITDADLIKCSTEINGSANNVNCDAPFNIGASDGLVQGKYYAVRVKPDDNGATEFAYSMELLLGAPGPCNDRVANPHTLGNYISGSDYSSGCTDGNAQGATDNNGAISGGNNNNVWFVFTAEDNADEEGYVNIYLNSVDGHGMTINVWQEVGGTGGIGPVANVSGTQETTNTNGDAWLELGHLTPGEDYYIELTHSESASTSVPYSLCLYDIPTNSLACPADEVTISPAGGGQCGRFRRDCALYYRVEVPAGTQSGWYIFEVIGNGGDADIQLFGQGSDAPSDDGSPADYDQPCNYTHALNPMSGSQITIPADGSCNNGTGESATYNLIGSSTTESNYYYLEVDAGSLSGCDMSPSDICSITVSGPFSTDALAQANGTPDEDCSITAPLPVDLVSFTGKTTDLSNQLTWVTATEVNVAYFEIQRQETGEAFTAIGKVTAAGFSSTNLTYVFEDRNFVKKAYYRLKMVDFDGKVEYSQIIVLEREGDGYLNDIRLVPNPTQNEVNVLFSEDITAETTINIFDVHGKLVATQMVLPNAEMTVNIQLNNLPNGLYLVRIFNANQMKAMKLMKN